MRLMAWYRRPWRVDVALLLTLSLLFSPALLGRRWSDLDTSAQAAAQTPAAAVRPILVVPLRAAEGVPADVPTQVTYALVEELETSRRFSPTRLSLEEPTVRRLIGEGRLTEDAVTQVLQQPTPEGIAEIASAMQIADAVFGTVDSYAYDKANNGVVKVKVTTRFLKIDPTTGAVTETKEIVKEGSSTPKLQPAPEEVLAAEAFRNAVRQVVDELLGRPPTVRPVEVPKKGLGALPALLGLLILGAVVASGRGRGGVPAAPAGPVSAPSRVTAFPQGSTIAVTWQPPQQGNPIGYNVYRADAGTALGARQSDVFQKLNTSPIPATQYLDTQVAIGRIYLYAVTAVYPNNTESERVLANMDITGQPVPVGVGVPLPPRNLQAQPGDGAVQLTWEDTNPAGFVRGFRIYRRAGAPPTDTDLIADETTVRTTTFTDRGLQNGQTYFYVVRAVSVQNFLSAPSTVVSATPGNLPPQALTLNGQFNPNNLTVVLSWTPSPDPDIAYYEVARLQESIQRSRALPTRLNRQTPIINLPPGIAQRILQSNPRLRQASSQFDNAVIATNITSTTYVDNVANFRPNGANPTTYTVLSYAVRAVDQSGNKGPWSNVVQITPNSPPPSLAGLHPRVVANSGQVLVDLKPLLDAAAADSEWQVDKRGVRIFRATVKGGTQAAALTPIHAPTDPLRLDQLEQGRYFRDTQVTNGTRYYYAVELVDALGVPGQRSQEAAATPFSAATIAITTQGNRAELSGNGQDSVQLTISVADANGRPVAGFPVLLSLTGSGTLTVDPAYRDPDVSSGFGAITDENGQVLATYQAPTVTNDTTVTITASPSGGITGVNPAQLTLTVRFPRVASIEVLPQKTQLTADGADVTNVTITVKDTLGQPVPNKNIALTVIAADSTKAGKFEDPSSGNQITQVSSGPQGTAQVRYRAGTKAGSVTLQASVMEGNTTITGQAVVTLVAGSPANITLVANPSSAPADGSTEVRVTATVVDAQGNPVPRVQVQFSATPTLTITPSTATTDDTGQATVSVVAPTRAGAYNLQARVGTIAATRTLNFGAGAASTLTLSVSRTDLVVSLPRSFDEMDYSGLIPFARADITVTVLDANNNPAPNVVVQFTATAGTIQSSATTNEAGTATAVYIAPTAVPAGGQVTINAQAGSASGSIQLNILPGPPAKVRITATPLVLPADGRSSSQVRAEVRDANDNLVADGTRVVFSARDPNNLSQFNPNAGQFLQFTVPTTNGVATATFIAGIQPGQGAVLVAQAFGTVFGQSFGPVPAETQLLTLAQQGVLPKIQLGGQIQLTASALEMSVSDRDDNATDTRNSLRAGWRDPTNNYVDLTVQIVNGQGQPAPISGQPVFFTSTDSRVLFVDLASNTAGLGGLQVSTNNEGRAQVRVFASRQAGPVTLRAELRDASGNAFSSQSVTVRQRPGIPALVVVPPPQPNILFVPGAGTPTSTTVSATVYDAASNLVEDGILVRWTAEAGAITAESTTVNGRATATLSSTLDTGRFAVTARASVGQNQPAEGSTFVLFAVNVTNITVTANPNDIVGNGQSTATITATLTGTIPDNTRVRVSTDRGYIRQSGSRSVFLPVVGNALATTFISEAVTNDTTATIRVEAVNLQGQIVTGTAPITLRRPPVPIVLQPLQVETTNLSVSSSNATDPNQRTALGPEPNKTTVTVLVQEQNTNIPVSNASVTLSSSDPNGLWVWTAPDNTTRTSLGGITVTTDSNGRAVATYYTSTDTPQKRGEGTVTLTAQLGNQQQQAQITVRAGPPETVNLTVSGAQTAPDGAYYIFVPGAGTPTSATIIATVKDARGNAVRDGTRVFFSVENNEGTFSPANQALTSNNNGQAQVTLNSSSATGEFTIFAQAQDQNGNPIGQQGTTKIRYAANVPDITSIAADPTAIPDDGQSKSTITVRLPAPDNTRFRVSTDVGTLIAGNQQGPSVVATVNNEQAQVQLLGPGNLTAEQPATVTAEIVANNGSIKRQRTQVTLQLPVEVKLTFPTDLPPNTLVVSSSNSTDPNQRQPLDGPTTGHNKATVDVTVRGQNAPVTLLASEGNILFEVTTGSNQGTKQLATVTGTPTQGSYKVNMYASTVAGNFTLTVSVGTRYNKTFNFTQKAGLPGAIVVSAANAIIGVQGHPDPTLPKSTTIVANVRDAVGNPVANVPVFFSADDGTISPPSTPTDNNGVAQVTLTSSNFTRRVRVFGKVIGLNGQEITNFTLVTFVVGNLASIDLVPDRTDIPPNEVANVTVFFNPASEMPNNIRFAADLVGAYGVLESVSTTLSGRATIRIRNNNTTTAQQTAQLTVHAFRQDGLELTKSLSMNLLPISTPQSVELISLDFQQNPQPRDTIVVSDTNDTNPSNRKALDNTNSDHNRVQLVLTVRNLNAQSAEKVKVTLDATDPNGLFVPPTGAANVQGGLGSVSFEVTDNQTPDTNNNSGTIQVATKYYASRKAQPVTIRARVFRFDQQNQEQLYGEEVAIAIFQRPGPAAKAFFAVDPPRLAVSTVTGEPTQARLIATVYDANDNPVPNERVSFAIVDSEVVPYSDITAGSGTNVILTRYDMPSLSEFFGAQRDENGNPVRPYSGMPPRPDPNLNHWAAGGVPKPQFYYGFLGFTPPGQGNNWTGPQVPDPYYGTTGHPQFNHFYRLLPPSPPPRVADGAIGPQSEARTDANGVAITFLTSVNVCQPVTVKMVPQSNPALGRTFSTFYYVPVSRVDVFITSGGLVTGPGGTFTVEFRFSPPEALPSGTRVWVRIHGTAYDGDEDGDGLINEDPPGANNWDDDKDGRIDEDPAGDANGDMNNDDDFDGRTDEDPFGPNNADDDGDGRIDEDWNPQLIDAWVTVTVTEPGIVRYSIQNLPTGPDPANGWKVIQVFVWNRDGLRLMGQTSPITFP